MDKNNTRKRRLTIMDSERSFNIVAEVIKREGVFFFRFPFRGFFPQNFCACVLTFHCEFSGGKVVLFGATKYILRH